MRGDDTDATSDSEDESCPTFEYARPKAVASTRAGIHNRDSHSHASDAPSTSGTTGQMTASTASNDVFAIGRGDGSVVTWRIGARRAGERMRARRRHQSSVTALALDGDGKHLASSDASGVILVCSVADGDDEDSDSDPEEEELVQISHNARVTCVALERNFGSRGRGRGGIAYGDEKGGVHVRVSTIIGHKTLALSGQDERAGEVGAMAWSSRNILAWTCDGGVKLYDVGRDTKVALVERPRGSPPASMYRPHLVWNETSDSGRTLLVGWADCVKVVKMKKVDAASTGNVVGVLGRAGEFGSMIRQSGSGQQQQEIGGSSGDGDKESISDASTGMVYAAAVASMFQTEYFVAGIQPFGDCLAVLAWDGKDATFPELHVVSHTNSTLSIDVVPVNDHVGKLGCNALGLACAQRVQANGAYDRCRLFGEQRWWKSGFEPRFMIHSSGDAIVAKTNGVRETIDWLSSHEDYVTLLEVCETASRFGHMDGTTSEISHKMLETVFAQGDYARTAVLCSTLLRNDAPSWESWIGKFMHARQLAEIHSYIPVENPVLSANTYEVVLNAFLATPEHHARFLAAVKAWPSKLYSAHVLIPVVKSHLNSIKTSDSAAASVSSVVLKEALAELYLGDGQRERALNLYLDIGRPSVLNFIARHDLLPFVARDKLALLVQLDTPAAVSLFVKYREVLPPSVVIPQLLGHGGFNARQTTHLYMSSLFEDDPSGFEEYHDKLFELHLEFAHGALMDFLKRSTGYDVSRAATLLAGNESLVFERVFLLSKLGSHEEAVRVLLLDAKDLSGAIKLASELDNPIELWNVIIKVSTDSPDFMASLLAHAKTLAGNSSAIALVDAVRDGLPIENLKERLVDLMRENATLAKSLRHSFASESKRAREYDEQRSKANTRALRRHQIHVSRKR